MFQPASPQHFTLRLGAFFLFFTLSCALHAQTWHELMEDNAPFEEVEVAFRQGLTEFQLETGKGIKPFERMKYFWERRMDGEGQADYWNAYLAEFGQKGINTKDAGNWTSLGMAEWEAAYANNPGNGRVNSMTVDPSDADIVYIGAPSGGLWRSTDGGDSWSPLTDNLPTLGVNGIAVHPDDSGVIYIATGDGHGNSNYGMGVLKTTDGGITWSTTGMVWSIEENIRSHGISMHPNDPETLFVWSTDGLYKTINGGLTWYLVRGGNVHDLEFHPTNPDVVYCCTDRFYKSTDGGEDFDLINDNLPSSSEAFRMELAVSPDDPDRVYILAANSWDYGFLGVYESQDQGENWNTAADSPNILGWSMDGEGGGGQGWYDLDICVNPNDADHIFVGGVNLWESTNGGNSWSINAHWVLGNTQNYVHADIQYLGYKGNILWCGSDGGIFRSTNNGNSFSNKSSGLEIAQYYRFGMSPADPEYIIAGAQDNGCNLLSDGDWFHVLGADGMEAIVHPTDPDILFGASQYGGIRRSTNGGLEWQGATEGIDENGAWVTPYIMSPVNPDILISGYENIWRSSDLGSSWTVISDFAGAQFQNLAMSSANPNVIYASTNQRLYRTSDGGGDWEDVSAGLPSLGMTSVTASQLDADEVWVTFSGFSGGNKLYRSLDGGASWENMSGNLPNIPTNCLALMDSNDNAVYVGTDFGVYYKDDNLAGWESFNSGLPHVIVNEMMINTDAGKLVAATYGRGMWISDLWTTPSEAPSTAASYNSAFVCVGDSVFFQDQSTGNAPGWTWNFEGGTPGTLDQASGWVTYDTPGMYGFTLETANASGTSSYTCEDCIFVYDTLSTETFINEGFEYTDLQFAPGVWTPDEDADGNGWSVTNQASYGGDHSAWINNYTIDLENSYALSSQPYDLDTANQYIMTFRVAYTQITDDTNDRLRIYTSTDCGESWSLREQITASSGDLQGDNTPTTEAFVPTDNDQWEYFEFEVPDADRTPHTQFQFWFLSDNGNNIYLDNINLGAVNVEEQPVQSEWLQAYPNPGSGQCTLRFPGQTGGAAYVQITDAQGRVVSRSQHLTQSGMNTLELDTERLESGWYSIRVLQGGSAAQVTWIRR